MRYQEGNYKRMSNKELLKMESVIHDQEYIDSMLTALKNPLIIDVERILKSFDYEYKKGSYLRGYRRRRLYELINYRKLHGKKVLEVGTGIGQDAVILALFGAEVFAFDISKVGIEVGKLTAEANKVNDRCHFVIQSASYQAFKDCMFDIIIFNAVLHHVLKYPNIREETIRVLKKGGKVVFAEGIRGNLLYASFRKVYRFITGKKPKGDIDIDYNDIYSFSKGFSRVYFESFCLLLGVKELIGKPFNNSVLVRAVFYIAKEIDDFILKLFPKLRRYCSEIVGELIK